MKPNVPTTRRPSVGEQLTAARQQAQQMEAPQATSNERLRHLLACLAHLADVGERLSQQQQELLRRLEDLEDGAANRAPPRSTIY